MLKPQKLKDLFKLKTNKSYQELIMLTLELYLLELIMMPIGNLLL